MNLLSLEQGINRISDGLGKFAAILFLLMLLNVFYDVSARSWIVILCRLFLLFPFTLLVAWYGIGFAYEAYQIGEGSPDPGGLPYRWVIRSVITIAMVFNFISGMGLLLHSINILRGHHQDEVYVPTQH